MNQEVQRYIAAVSDDRRSLFDKLHALILGLYPEAEVGISYGIPTYRAKSRRVYLGYWKDGVSVHAVDVAEFKAKYPAIKTGKGSINFKVTDRVPVAALKKVIRQAIERPKRP